MSKREIFITEFDMRRLRALFDAEQGFIQRGRNDLKSLEAELDRARIVPPQEVPGDVITMNSTVRLVDLDNGEEMTYTLVFPNDADVEQDRISVLAPIGTAMLGYRVGDTFEWQVPEGMRRLRVKEILYQPESSGDYHL
jgi:regulator of nucleoside diphosphate kinase